MKKRALLVGINYIGTGYDLKGCINDANNMKLMLEGKGFTDITMLTEAAATTANMKAALINLVAESEPGDVLVFHYSGHGSQLPSTTEADGYEEIICPYDLDWRTNVITDDFLKSVFNSAPNGVNITVILDCCNSGDGLDTEVPSITVPITSNVVNPSGSTVVSTGTGITTSVTTNGVTSTVYSSRYLPPPAHITKITSNQKPVEWSASKNVSETAMLVAACKSYQTSADAFISGYYQGAATAALLDNVAKNAQITYRQLINGMQAYMKANNFTQTPELDGAEQLKDKIFIEPWKLAASAPTETVTVPTPVIPFLPNIQEDKKDNTLAIVVIVIIVIVIGILILG
jgi:hypothetical protein